MGSVVRGGGGALQEEKRRGKHEIPVRIVRPIFSVGVGRGVKLDR